MVEQDICLVVSRLPAFDDPYFKNPLTVLIDDAEVEQLKPEEMKKIVVSPGKHTVQINHSAYKSRPITFEASPGPTLYFETGFTRNMLKRMLKAIYVFLDTGVIELRERNA